MMHSKSVVMIPCKIDSTRLSNKNLSLIGNKTLLEYSIGYAQECKYVSQIVVSTESELVKNICKKYDVLIHDRPEELLGDADTVDVYVDVFKYFDFEDDITHVVGLQPDNPDIHKSLNEIIEYFVEKKYDDLVTVGTDGTRNGSVRLVKSEFVRDNNISRRVGTILDDCTNIHTIKDLKKAKERLLND